MHRLLIADDHPLSRRVLEESVRQLGWMPHAVHDGDAALACARAERFDALLLDLSMPRRGGREVLQSLRGDASAASQHSFAIATSAELGADIEAGLLRLGFDAVLAKPFALADFAAVLADVGGAAIDDTAALAACGDATLLRQLRALFLAELEAVPGELAAFAANGDRDGLRDRLHRLRASCGFCGAPALDLACRRAQRRLEAGFEIDREALQQSLAATRAAMAGCA